MTNLRYIDLYCCKSITQLPSSITKLQNLHTLHLSLCKSLENFPVNLGKLTKLTTLKYFPVGVGGKGSPSCARLRELHGLNQLSGELRIEGLENVRDARDAEQANLKDKPYLTSLQFDYDDGDGDDDDDDENYSLASNDR
uniref:R13L1/DRL21-like LRR repeat region domain-containing protein n=1 Tax=Nelumbo nucifera TaxID=4432 RepID=A0A822ZBT2_NELNU|nr:TPA_asm: hypothetical protein HUJ06_000597 [Nelumbo nucifera]